MSLSSETNNYSSVLSSNTKLQALELSLQQSLLYFKDLLLDFEQLHLQSDSYKTQFITQKEKCDSNNCSGSESLKKIIESKNQIIQLVASTLTKLSETKNFSLLDDAFKILFGETNTINTNIEDNKSNITTLQSPKEEPNDSIAEEISFNDESLGEIDGTPTGRTSPIIPARKLKGAVGKSSDFRDKKKCPNDWNTSENKNIKLSYPTPTRTKPIGRLRQASLTSNLFKVKQTNVVDLTCSPEFSGGIRSCKEPLIKKESMENEDTILPSPTSAPASLMLFKPKDSPVKFKKPNLSLKIKREIESTRKLDLLNIENLPDNDITEMEDSINILNQMPKRHQNSLKKASPKEVIERFDEDATHCDTMLSVSLLQDVNKTEEVEECSPTRRPLAENINITNTPTKSEHVLTVNKMAAANVKRKTPEFAEPLYKEPTVRKKIEKRALPGWCCEECKHFFGELYGDDPVMIAKKIAECSKHRGRHNPVRPTTPPNFWNPRWEVPEDTEELNRMNNAG